MLIHGRSKSTLLSLLVYMGYMQHSVCLETSQCLVTKTTKLAILSARNETGQWSSKVTLENPEAYGLSSGEGILDSDHWKIELDQGTGECGAKESFSAVIELPTPPASLGYKLFEGVGHYKFHDQPRLWTDAVNVCEQEDAHLAIINSKQEEEVLKQIFELHKNIPGADLESVAAIGFHDRYAEGKYLTVFDEPLASTGFVRWSTIMPQPNNDPTENCGSMDRDGGLYCISCDIKVAFICEKDL